MSIVTNQERHTTGQDYTTNFKWKEREVTRMHDTKTPANDTNDEDTTGRSHPFHTGSCSEIRVVRSHALCIHRNLRAEKLRSTARQVLTAWLLRLSSNGILDPKRALQNEKHECPDVSKPCIVYPQWMSTRRYHPSLKVFSSRYYLDWKCFKMFPDMLKIVRGDGWEVYYVSLQAGYVQFSRSKVQHRKAKSDVDEDVCTQISRSSRVSQNTFATLSATPRKGGQ